MKEELVIIKKSYTDKPHIVESLQSQLDYHLSEANKIKELLSNIIGYKDDKLTLKERVVNTLLSSGRPLTGRCIFNDLSMNISYKTFSPQLSIIVKSGAIFKYLILKNPIREKNYYCLQEWVDNGILLDEYSSKIR